MSLTVLQSGTQTLIMDAGRPGYRHQGIPGGGAADRLSFAIANHLVGNKWDTPALERGRGDRQALHGISVDIFTRQIRRLGWRSSENGKYTPYRRGPRRGQ